MPKPERIDRVITEDSYGYYCIDTYLDLESYPLVGYGYTEEQAINDAEYQARMVWGE